MNRTSYTEKVLWRIIEDTRLLLEQYVELKYGKKLKEFLNQKIESLKVESQ